MRMPSINKHFLRAKKAGKKAMILYLGDPQDPLAPECLYEAFLSNDQYKRIENLMKEISNSRQDC
jgi:hypothetical protein